MTTARLSVAERIQALSLCPVFSRVPAGDLRVLAEMMETERLGAGEVLFEHGDPAERIYVVAAGSLEVFLPGDSDPVRALRPGALLGEYGMFSGTGRTATVKADTAATLLSIDERRFRAFLLQFPESTLVLLEIAAKRLVTAEARAARRLGKHS